MSNNSNGHSQSPYFSGAGRSLDGGYVPPTRREAPVGSQPLPTNDYNVRSGLLIDEVDYHGVQQQNSVPISTNANPSRKSYLDYLSTNFWEFNFDDPSFARRASNTFILSCCPCCLPMRKGMWLKVCKTVTFYLLIIQALLYIITLTMSKDMSWLLNPDLAVLIQFGANGNQFLRKYQFHRLLSYNILHGSIIHIIMNSLSQFVFIMSVENSWEKWRFLTVYISTSIIGGLFCGMRKGIVAVGASCSILGIACAFAAIILIAWPQIDSRNRKIYINWLILIPLQFFVTSFLPSVDWAGHLGGIAGGLFVGCIVFCHVAENATRKKITLAIGIVGTLISVIAPLCVIFLN